MYVYLSMYNHRVEIYIVTYWFIFYLYIDTNFFILTRHCLSGMKFNADGSILPNFLVFSQENRENLKISKKFQSNFLFTVYSDIRLKYIVIQYFVRNCFSNETDTWCLDFFNHNWPLLSNAEYQRRLTSVSHLFFFFSTRKDNFFFFHKTIAKYTYTACIMYNMYTLTTY